MKKLFLVVMFCMACIGVSAQSQRYKLNVGQFDRLSVFDNVNVVYRSVPDSAGYVVYDGVEDFADAFIFTNSGGNLKIQVSTEDVGKPDLPVIYAYSDYLVSVENSSLYTVKVEKNAPVPKFTAKIIGNGEIVAEGLKCTEVTATLNTGNGRIILSGMSVKTVLKMLGTGLIQADRLETKEVVCKVMGSGSIGCWAREKLDVRGIGSTKIYYKGNPQIKKVGGGKIFPLTAATNEELEKLEDEPLQVEKDLKEAESENEEEMEEMEELEVSEEEEE